jgi:hypothetical protein
MIRLPQDDQRQWYQKRHSVHLDYRQAQHDTPLSKHSR